MIKNPLFDKAELEKERNVIFEEIKMRKDNPRIYVFDKIQCCLYKGTLGIPLIGTRDTMNLIDREKIIKRFAEAYQPNNLILAVVGNADFDKIVKFAEKEFVKTKGKIYTSPVELKNDISIEERKDIDQANLVFAYHTPLANDKKSYAAEALSTLMAGGMSSRLFLEIREKRNLAYAVKGDSNINKDFSYNVIYIGTTKNNAELVKELILNEFENVAKENEFYTPELVRKVARMGTIQECKEIPKESRDIFVTSQDISPQWHIKMQATLQKHVDNSISKTINFPSTASIKDVEEAYMLAWQSKCKGLTIYRDGSYEDQVMNIG